MKRYVPEGVNPDSKNWPLVLAFAVLMEQQMEAHKDRDAGGGRNWLDDTPVSLMQHLLEEVQELDDAVAARQNGILRGGPDGEARVCREGADAGNLAMMVVDSVVGLQPVRWPIMDSPDPFHHLTRHEENSERTAGEGPFVTCLGAELYLMGILLDRLQHQLSNWYRRAAAQMADEEDPEQSRIAGFVTQRADLRGVEVWLKQRAVQYCENARDEAVEAAVTAGCLDT